MENEKNEVITTENDIILSIVDKINEVSDHHAIAARDLGESLQRSAPSLAAAGNTLDQSIALTVAANDIIQDPVWVGEMWKDVATRVRSVKTESELEELEAESTAESVSRLREQVMALTNTNGTGGFDILANDETLKSTYDIILGISKRWANMNDIDKAELLELLAGARYSNALAATLSAMQNIKKRKPRKKKSHSYTITNEELTYKIIDAGLLCELRGVKNSVPRAWYFNKNPDVKAVIDQFKAAGGTV